MVAKNVEPYSIVGGNPARHLKYRFEDVRLREMLKSLNYGNFNLKLVDDENLEKLYPDIQYVNRLMTHSWGQTVIRFYDLDGNLIEVGTPVS